MDSDSEAVRGAESTDTAIFLSCAGALPSDANAFQLANVVLLVCDRHS